MWFPAETASRRTFLQNLGISQMTNMTNMKLNQVFPVSVDFSVQMWMMSTRTSRDLESTSLTAGTPVTLTVMKRLSTVSRTNDLIAAESRLVHFIFLYINNDMNIVYNYCQESFQVQMTTHMLFYWVIFILGPEVWVFVNPQTSNDLVWFVSSFMINTFGRKKIFYLLFIFIITASETLSSFLVSLKVR